VISLKNHTNKILDVWRKVIKQSISTWVTVITQAKFVYPIWSNADLV